MLRLLALRSPTPSSLWLRHKHSGCLRLAAAHPHLRLTCTHGPGRAFADRRGTTLQLKHRLQLRDGASKKMTRTCHQDDARTATGHLREDSSCCQRVGAVVLPNHPQRIAACEAVLEEAARSCTLNPPHWRRAARSGLSLRESPSPKVGPFARPILRCAPARWAAATPTSSGNIMAWS